MAPEVYYQVRVVVADKILDDIFQHTGSDAPIPVRMREAAVRYLRQNHLTPYQGETVMVKKEPPITPRFNCWLITAWVKDELCENYKPKGEE